MIDITNTSEDYAYINYKYLMPDCIAFCFDLETTGLTFLSKNNITGAVFASYTIASKFLKTLKNICKEIKNGLFRCRN